MEHSELHLDTSELTLGELTKLEVNASTDKEDRSILRDALTRSKVTTQLFIFTN
jgi:hypothetical protein